MWKISVQICLQICSAGESVSDARGVIDLGGVSVAIVPPAVVEHGKALRVQEIWVGGDRSCANACAASCNMVLLRLLRSR